mmetsp:Transcript_26206/g.62524  ORF Transcript_26206/g.62524 Transcript_26206/m.62524 type:complete len:289 (-) Transcript_26206:352-1218(-)
MLRMLGAEHLIDAAYLLAARVADRARDDEVGARLDGGSRLGTRARLGVYHGAAALSPQGWATTAVPRQQRSVEGELVRVAVRRRLAPLRRDMRDARGLCARRGHPGRARIKLDHAHLRPPREALADALHALVRGRGPRGGLRRGRRVRCACGRTARRGRGGRLAGVGGARRHCGSSGPGLEELSVEVELIRLGDRSGGQLAVRAAAPLHRRALGRRASPLHARLALLVVRIRIAPVLPATGHGPALRGVAALRLLRVPQRHERHVQPTIGHAHAQLVATLDLIGVLPS